MRTAILLMSCVVNLLHLTRGYSFDENPLDNLNSQIESIYKSIYQVMKIYRDDIYHHPLPKEYLKTFKKASVTLNKSLKLIDEIMYNHCRNVDKIDSSSSEEDNVQLTRRSNRNLIDEKDFYKALSRALRNEYKDQAIIQENIQESFSPPTWLNKRYRQ